MRQAAHEHVEKRQTLDSDPWFTSEYFAYILQRIPGVFYTLGVGGSMALHTSEFDPDESELRTGNGFMAYLAWTQFWSKTVLLVAYFYLPDA